MRSCCACGRWDSVLHAGGFHQHLLVLRDLMQGLVARAECSVHAAPCMLSAVLPPPPRRPPAAVPGHRPAPSDGPRARECLGAPSSRCNSSDGAPQIGRIPPSSAWPLSPPASCMPPEQSHPCSLRLPAAMARVLALLLLAAAASAAVPPNALPTSPTLPVLGECSGCRMPLGDLRNMQASWKVVGTAIQASGGTACPRWRRRQERSARLMSSAATQPWGPAPRHPSMQAYRCPWWPPPQGAAMACGALGAQLQPDTPSPQKEQLTGAIMGCVAPFSQVWPAGRPAGKTPGIRAGGPRRRSGGNAAGGMPPVPKSPPLAAPHPTPMHRRPPPPLPSCCTPASWRWAAPTSGGPRSWVGRAGRPTAARYSQHCPAAATARCSQPAPAAARTVRHPWMPLPRVTPRRRLPPGLQRHFPHLGGHPGRHERRHVPRVRRGSGGGRLGRHRAAAAAGCTACCCLQVGARDGTVPGPAACLPPHPHARPPALCPPPPWCSGPSAAGLLQWLFSRLFDEIVASVYTPEALGKPVFTYEDAVAVSSSSWGARRAAVAWPAARTAPCTAGHACSPRRARPACAQLACN